MKSASRKFLSTVVTALASVAILATLLAHYTNHVFVSSATFSGLAVSVVRTGAVESLLIDTVTDRVVEAVGDQTSVRPLIEDAVRKALSNGQTTLEIRAAARSLHSELVSGDANALMLTLPDVGASIASSVEPTSPQLADQLMHFGTITVVDVPVPSTATKVAHDLATVGRDSSLLLVFTAAMLSLALIISPDPRRTLLTLGLGAATSGLLVVGAYLVGRELLVNELSAPAARTAARAAWSVYLGGLESSGLVLAAIGTVTASAAALGLSRKRS
ncbi:MAG: hypothetical protein ACRDKL_12415 [Solirubrobacteraceae bacterium]